MKKMKRNIQKGFTLIELMIVIAIVAILVALAVPAYQDYTVRAKVGECVAQASSVKLAIEEFFQSEGAFPLNSVQAGLGTWIATDYCVTMTVGTSNGIITLTTQNTGAGAGNDPAMTLTPATAGGGTKITSWDCLRTAGENRHVPSSCRTTT